MVIKDALKKASAILYETSESPYTDSLMLLCHTLSVEKERIPIISSEELAKKDEEKFFFFIELRKKKMPVKYITGNCEFMGIDFHIEPGVLIPRPDTEVAAELLIEKAGNSKNKKIADICCGSGCIGLSALKFIPDAFCYLFDISDTALSVTKKNAELLDLAERAKIIKKDILTEEPDEKYGFIISNPPYISTEEYNELMEDVRLFEPELALHSPDDDLKFYKRITALCENHLESGGYLIFEVGYNQAERVNRLLSESGLFSHTGIKKDFSGIERVVFGKKS